MNATGSLWYSVVPMWRNQAASATKSAFKPHFSFAFPGIIGDWKTYFTVAQNERFNEEYKKQMSGYSFDFEKYM